MHLKFLTATGPKALAALLLASALLLSACGGSDDNTPAPILSVVSTTPADGELSAAMGTSTLSVVFNRALATTYDADTWSWPHLAEVMNYPGVIHRDPEVLAKIASAEPSAGTSTR